MILSLKSVGQVRQDGNSGKISMLILRQKSFSLFYHGYFSFKYTGKEEDFKKRTKNTYYNKKT